MDAIPTPAVVRRARVPRPLITSAARIFQPPPTTAAVPFLAIAAVVGGGWKILAAEVISGRGTRARLTTAGVGIAAMVAVDLLLVPAWGMRGAGIGAAVGYLAAGALIVRIWSRESGRSARELLGLRRGDLASLFPARQPMEAVGA